jgi:hypothetical protein
MIFTVFQIENSSCVVIDLRLKVNQNKNNENPHNYRNQTLPGKISNSPKSQNKLIKLYFLNFKYLFTALILIYFEY